MGRLSLIKVNPVQILGFFASLGTWLEVDAGRLSTYGGVAYLRRKRRAQPYVPFVFIIIPPVSRCNKPGGRLGSSASTLIRYSPAS